MARRLIESGVTFVELHLRGWDTHADDFNQCRSLCEALDQPFAALIRDLQDRGLLDRTLIVWLGEFGRTPRIEIPAPGRDPLPSRPSRRHSLRSGGVRGDQTGHRLGRSRQRHKSRSPHRRTSSARSTSSRHRQYHTDAYADWPPDPCVDGGSAVLKSSVKRPVIPPASIPVSETAMSSPLLLRQTRRSTDASSVVIHGRGVRATGRFSWVARLTLLPAFLSASSVADAADAPGSRSEFVKTHCVECHGQESQEAGLRLDALPFEPAGKDNARIWTKVFDRIRAGEMPPKDSPQPTVEQRRAVLDGLRGPLAAADLARRKAEGRSVIRRLNRTEYENTLRDLFDLPGLAVRDLLPEDGEAFGFDKSGTGLDLSYVQLARYMEAADVALDMAIAPHAEPPAHFKAHIPAGGCQTFFAQAFRGNTVFLRDFKYDDSLIPIPEKLVVGKDERLQKLRRENLKNAYDGSIGVLVPEGVGTFKPRFPFRVVYPGRYRLRMSVWSFLWDKGEVKPSPRTESALLSAESRTLGYFDAPSLEPKVTEIEVWLNPMKTPRDEILFDAASLWPAGPINGNLARYTGPGIAVDWLEIEGPLMDQWPAAGHRRLFGDLPMKPLPPQPKRRGQKVTGSEPAGGDIRNPLRPPENAFVVAGHGKPFLENVENLTQKFEYSTVASENPEADARRLLGDFLPRAFRRPVPDHELTRYVELFRSRFDEGDTFEVAMRMSYKAALCSPEFLFVRPSPWQFNAWDLAERLSYFLWNSMPDDELFELARSGRLSEPEVLRSQVERMLGDPKSARFVNDHRPVARLADIDATTPGRKLYPEFRLILRDAMRKRLRLSSANCWNAACRR